ncbi:MAG: hypothetical protein JWM48_3031 [Mycobacterium sp.]|nr:hypothetical protein [Mycobacterium sp.]
MTSPPPPPGGWQDPPPPGGWQQPPPPPGGYPPPPGGWQQPPPGAPWGWQPDPRPGVVPLRPLTLGDILDGAFRTVVRHWRICLGGGLVLGLVLAVLGLIANAVTGESTLSVRVGQPYSGFSSLGSSLGSASLALLLAIIRNTLGAAFVGLLAAVLSQAALGPQVDARQALARVRERWGALLVVGFVSGFVPNIALILFILPGAFLWGTWAVAPAAVVLERAGPGQALGRSWRLTLRSGGTWWRVWGIRAVSVLIGGAVSIIIVIPFEIPMFASIFGGIDSGTVHIGFGEQLLMSVGGLISTALVLPFEAAVVALLYLDLRMRQEGLDVTLRQAAAGN